MAKLKCYFNSHFGTAAAIRGTEPCTLDSKMLLALDLITFFFFFCTKLLKLENPAIYCKLHAVFLKQKLHAHLKPLFFYVDLL